MAGIVAGAVAAGLALTTGTAPATASAPADLAARPAGLAGGVLTLENGDIRFHDVVRAPSGTTYVVWANNSRQVRSCALPVGASACSGGIHSVAAPGDVTGLAAGVVAGGQVRLMWTYDTAMSVSSDWGGQLASSVINADGSLSAPSVRATTPSWGRLLSVAVHNDGTMWSVVAPEAGATGVWVYPFSSPAFAVATPYWAGEARIAFGRGTAVMAISKYGSITTPIAAARWTGTTFAPFVDVAGTWNGPGVGLANSTDFGAIKLVASDASASYQPVSYQWDGTRFTNRRVSGLTKCWPTSMDLTYDASGRFVNATNSPCGVTIANMHWQGPAADVAFSPGGTMHDVPQAATSRRGTGWVAWSTEGDNGALDKLKVAPILVPSILGKVSKRFKNGTIRTAGILPCLTPVSLRIPLGAKGRKGWRVANKKLLLDGHRVRDNLVDGARLAAGSQHRLVAKVTFAKGTRRVARSIATTVFVCES